LFIAIAVLLLFGAIILQIVSLQSNNWLKSSKVIAGNGWSDTVYSYWGTISTTWCASTYCNTDSYATLADEAAEYGNSSLQRAYVQLRSGGALAIAFLVLSLAAGFVSILLLAVSAASTPKQAPPYYALEQTALQFGKGFHCVKLQLLSIPSATLFFTLAALCFQLLGCFFYVGLFPYSVLPMSENYTIGLGLAALIAAILLSVAACVAVFVMRARVNLPSVSKDVINVADIDKGTVALLAPSTSPTS